MHYDHKAIEEKWRKEWRERGTYRVTEDPARPKYYVLDMFPYPSGAGLHVGHPLGYIASDIVARWKRHQGFCVLHPMGYDAFGLPAEQYAIQTGQHPAVTTATNIERYREQLDRIGFSFDREREVLTSDPSFYKWTQWIFLQLFDSWYDPRKNKAEPIATLMEHFELQGYTGDQDPILTGDIEEEIQPFTADDWKKFDEREQQRILQNFRLAYLGDAWVNWCPALGTVLANDEVKDGVSERGGHPVERKRMPQWSLRITAYAQRLLDGLDDLDWSESIKTAQRNWIGRSEGALVKFSLRERNEVVEVFTTRPDTLFGVTFITLAPEHELVDQIVTADRKEEVMAYVNSAKNRSERERQADVKRVSGVFTGAYCIHPFTGEEIPVWVGDYVLSGYGTGAVMAVPGGDQRDWNFAKHFGLPIIAVTEGADIDQGADERKDAKLINSGFLNGLPVEEAITAAIDELIELGAGERRVNYRLRDAAFGRQRYWGEPIPIYYKDGIPYPLPESELPLKLPEIDKFQPTESGEPPLARAENWKYKGFPLETTTMPGWAGSSWYFLRYMDPKNPDRFASEEKVDFWKQVDLYVGGAEHATGHLLYFRFWTKFLFDRGWIPFDEPAQRLVNQGMIQGVSAMIRRLRLSSTRNSHGRSNLDEAEYEEVDDGFFIEKMEGPEVFVSSDLYQDWVDYYSDEKHSINFEMARHLEAYASLLPQDIHLSMPIPGHYDSTLIHVPISFLINEHALNVDSLKKGEPLFGNAIFWNREEFLVERQPEKMSKSKFNVVNPDEIIEKYGADTLRLYEMFLGPLEQSKPWDTNGIEGTFRFLRKFWNLFHENDVFKVSEAEPDRQELKVLHATIKKVSDDIDRMSFNTSVSQFMIAANQLGELKCNKRAILEPLTILLAPFAPHIAEELWQLLGHAESITIAPWPAFREEYLIEDSFSYPISFNGKTRLQLEFPIALSKEEVEAAVLANPEVQQRLEGKPPKKVIVVPKRIVNIVV